MQKISTYLYPNRVQLLADLAGFNVEYTNVYQRIVNIYKGVDNVIEFDIKNADQKRLELVTAPSITNITLNVMDAAGNSIGTYTADVDSGLKGIAVVTIPSADLAAFTPQFFRYSVTATKGEATIPLYADSKFGAIGKMELIGTAVAEVKPTTVYKSFAGEINGAGEVIKHSPAIPTTFYEAVPTTQMNVHADIVDFIGKIYIHGTPNATISVNSWLNAPKIMEFTFSAATTTTVHFHPLDIGDYQYFRVSWENSSIARITLENTEGLAGHVAQITADVGPGE